MTALDFTDHLADAARKSNRVTVRINPWMAGP